MWSGLHLRRRASFAGKGTGGREIRARMRGLLQGLIKITAACVRAGTAAVRRRGCELERFRTSSGFRAQGHSAASLRDSKRRAGGAGVGVGARRRSEAQRMGNPEKPNSQRQKVEWWSPGTGEKGIQSKCLMGAVLVLQDEKSSVDGWR